MSPTLAKNESDNIPQVELFMGDRGTLPLAGRSALTTLLSGPFIEKERSPMLYGATLKHFVQLREILHNMLLELCVDEDRGLAFLRQIDLEELDDAGGIKTLLRKKPLTLIETIVVVFLRQKLIEADALGSRCVVDVVDIMEHCMLFSSQTSTDKGLYSRRVLVAIESIRNLNILSPLQGSPDRFEVSSVLASVFRAQDIEALSELLCELAQAKEIASEKSPVQTLRDALRKDFLEQDSACEAAESQPPTLLSGPAESD